MTMSTVVYRFSTGGYDCESEARRLQNTSRLLPTITSGLFCQSGKISDFDQVKWSVVDAISLTSSTPIPTYILAEIVYIII